MTRELRFSLAPERPAESGVDKLARELTANYDARAAWAATKRRLMGEPAELSAEGLSFQRARLAREADALIARAEKGDLTVLGRLEVLQQQLAAIHREEITRPQPQERN